MLRRNLVSDVFGGIGYLLPQPIDRGGQLRAAPLGLTSQFLHGSCHDVTLLDLFQDELTLCPMVPRAQAEASR